MSARFAVERWVVASGFELVGVAVFHTLPLFPLLSPPSILLPFSPVFLPTPPSLPPFSLLCLDEWFSKGKILLLVLVNF